jgi:hypothetical protein
MREEWLPKTYVVLVITGKKKGRYQMGITLSPLWKWKMETGRQITAETENGKPTEGYCQEDNKRTMSQLHEVVSSW